MAEVQASRLIIPVHTNADNATAALLRLDATLNRMDGTLGKIGSALDKNSKSTQKSVSGFDNLKKKLLAGGVIYALKRLGEASLNAARDAEETRDKFGIVFEGVREEAFKTADEFARGFGLATDTAQKLLSNTGDLLTGFGFTDKAALDLSTTVNSLAADLASFSNIEGGAERASKALTSAILGETEAAKALGIVIRAEDVAARLAAKGLSELTGQAKLQAEAQARIEISLEQSQKAIGNYALTANSAANVSRRFENRTRELMITIGNELSPAIRDLQIAFLNSSEAGGILTTVIRYIASAVGKAIQFLTLIIRKLDELGIRLRDIKGGFSGAYERMKQFSDVAEEVGESEAFKKIAISAQLSGESVETALSRMASTGDESAKKLIQAFSQLEGEAARFKVGKNIIIAEQKLLGTFKEVESQAPKTSNAIRQVGGASESAAGNAKKLAETLKNALTAQAGAGDISAQIQLLEQGFAEQRKVVQQAGLDVSNLVRFQEQQRVNAVQQALNGIVNNENLSFQERFTQLQEQYALINELDQGNFEGRLQSQQAYTQASIQLEQNRIRAFANGLQTFGQLGNGFLGILNNLAQVQANLGEQEIARLEEQGASEEQIDQRRRELAREQAIRQKRLARIGVILDTATAIGHALATPPFPLGLALSAIAAAKGATQLAVIESTPIPSAQNGGSFTVPPGRPADTGLLRVNSGEEITVNPVRHSGQNGTSSMPKQINVSIDGRDMRGFIVEEINRAFNSGDAQIRRQGAIKTA